MAVIGIAIRPEVSKAAALGRELLNWCNKKGHEVLLEADAASALEVLGSGCSKSSLAERASIIVTLGGDGTLLGIAREVRCESPLFLGVNFGTLGFLTEISPDEVFSILELAIAGKAPSGQRNMLQVDVQRAGMTVFSSQAVNDAVVQKDGAGKLPSIDFYVNDDYVMRLRGDGLIMATPTGSTAYSLSAGGTIVYPSLGVVLVTPICPHALTNRPFILPIDRCLRVVVPQFEEELALMVDGQAAFALEAGDEVRVTRSPHTLRFVRSPRQDYFSILRGKLHWGIGNKLETDNA